MARLPKSLLIALSLVSIGSFACSLYLEATRLDFLQAHPIMVNLISGVVGFSTAAVVVGVGFNWYTTRIHAGRHSIEIKIAVRNVLEAWIPVIGLNIRSEEAYYLVYNMLALARYSPRSIGRILQLFQMQKAGEVPPVNLSRNDKLAQISSIIHVVIPSLLGLLGETGQFSETRSIAERDFQIAKEKALPRRGIDESMEQLRHTVGQLIGEVLRHPTIKQGMEVGPWKWPWSSA
ncbi:hypothetical protein [Sphaerisporangium fuscum]|uniref:hypothetical protein n=1 Tax=Sphaerisporangium fuscum TaxID=2835868 RepID=UPI001BDD377E|nr:hypothetical protein [Sphaerisporangium fuscum]